MGENVIKIIDLDNQKAKKSFLKSSNYFTQELPEYFDFSPILQKINSQLKGKNNHSITLDEVIGKNETNKKPHDVMEELRNAYNVNINLYLNKDGEYDWRKLQIINPYLYVNLVNLITQKNNWELLQNRFNYIREQCEPKIICTSIPFINVDNNSETSNKDVGINWWKQFEQESIRMALDYKYCIRTDLANCYASIYTHTISWALHGKKEAKEKKNKKSLLGNQIDNAIQNMQNGQTNGIPQGSILFDLIAELVLGYSDLELEEKLCNEPNKFKILRYRDDYRIFANNKETLDKIIKNLSSVSADLNMHFNNAKTNISNDIINNSIKPDKMYWLNDEVMINSMDISNQKKLLMIYKLVLKYPNSGSIRTALISFRKELGRL